MLESEEENGGVKRMLGVCSEFERIAKVVLDKAEMETSSRRKRKSHDNPEKNRAPPMSNHAAPPPPPPPPPQTPMISNTQTPALAGVFPSSIANQMNPQNGFSPMNGNGSPNSGVWQHDFGNGSEYMTPNSNGMTPFTDIQGYTNGNEINSPLNLNSFQQPFVPQDLWQMPMTLEWDWADMTGGAYPSFENGIVGDPALQNTNNQHLQHQQMR
jgi:hypothetical protein